MNKSKRNLNNMVGWLFADVLLALLIVFIGSEVRHSRIEPVNSSSPEIVKIGVLEPTPIDVDYTVQNPGGLLRKDPAAISEFINDIENNEKFFELYSTSRFAPVVEVFSWAPNKDTGYAKKMSQAICDSLLQRGDLVQSESICLPYHDLSLSNGQVKFRMFLVAKQ